MSDVFSLKFWPPGEGDLVQELFRMRGSLQRCAMYEGCAIGLGHP